MPAEPARDIQIEALLVGQVAPLGPKAKPSGIAKFPVDGPRRAHATGIEDDQQADLKNHGGRDKAVHHYPRDHYADWLAELPHAPEILKHPGAFGENISTRGLTEADVCVGDIYSVGDALFEVSQARQPCWKLNARFEHKAMAMAVQTTRRTGWYYRVLREGEIAAGDTLRLQERPHADWPLTRLISIIYDKSKDASDLRAMAELEVLASSWRALAQKRLDSNRVEDWGSRLGTD
ncbi:MAG: MOSC domain-containing protein [Myxococcota bacterium]